MIELTREEALMLLRKLALIEGFLMGVKDNSAQYIVEEFDCPVELLTKKLLGDE